MTFDWGNWAGPEDSTGWDLDEEGYLLCPRCDRWISRSEHEDLGGCAGCYDRGLL